jgi:hypothetical protein
MVVQDPPQHASQRRIQFEHQINLDFSYQFQREMSILFGQQQSRNVLSAWRKE